MFSAHGVSPTVVQAAADRELQAIDATCPLVTKVHREAIRFAKADAQILLIGHAGHEEVEGTMGHAPERTILVGSPDDVDELDVGDPENLVWISQTTLSVDETMETVRRLRERFPNLQDPPSDDICYATQNRQVAIKKVAQGRRPRDRRRLGQQLEQRAARRCRPRERREGRLPRRLRERDQAGVARRRRDRSA